MEIICVNGSFPPDYIAFYEQFGVKTPIQDSLYTIRSVRKDYIGGKTGVLLEELVNPEVPIKHDILSQIKMEPTWDLLRFRHLNGDLINRTEIQEFITKSKDIAV